MGKSVGPAPEFLTSKLLSCWVLGQACETQLRIPSVDDRPIVHPFQCLQPLNWHAAHCEILGVKNEQTLAAGSVNIRGASARRIPRGVSLEQHGSTAIHHERSSFVHKGSMRGGRALHCLLVIVLRRCSLAAEIH